MRVCSSYRWIVVILLALQLYEVHSQIDCIGSKNFLGYTRVIEDFSYNVSTSAVAFDTRGSLYGCGLEENENDDNYNPSSAWRQAYIFKLLSASSGVPSLSYMQIITPNTYSFAGQSSNMKNLTSCTNIAWIGSFANPDDQSPPVGYVVFAGESTSFFPNQTLSNEYGFIAQLKDDDITSLVQITTQRTFNSIDAVLSFDHKRLFILGITQTFYFSKTDFYDCSILEIGVDLQSNQKGAFFGTQNRDTCESMATNRYDWKVALTQSIAASTSKLVCQIVMMNDFYHIGWSKEFGKDSTDVCKAVEISHDGFVAFVSGYLRSYTSTATNIQMFILTISTSSGQPLSYKEFGGTYVDRIQDMKLWHNTLFVIGDIQSWYAQTSESRGANLPYVYSTFAMRINVDQLDLNCFKTQVTINSTFFIEAIGKWKSSTFMIPFRYASTYAIQIRSQDTLTDNSAVPPVQLSFPYYTNFNQASATFKQIQTCTVSSQYYDQQTAKNMLSADTLSELTLQQMNYCQLNIAVGINTVTFTNYTVFPIPAVSLTGSSNPYGFFFEKAKNQLNGQPTMGGDFGIRYQYTDSNGFGIANYAFLHVDGSDINLLNEIYMTDALFNQPYQFKLDEKEIFSVLKTRVVEYKIIPTAYNSWMKINQTSKVIYGIPDTFVDCKTINPDGFCKFTIIAKDITGGKTNTTVRFKIINSAPVMQRQEFTDVLCIQKDRATYYQIPFEKYFTDADLQNLRPIVSTNGFPGFNIAGLNFQEQFRQIIGKPTSLKSNRVLVSASDTVLQSQGKYGLQIEVIPQSPYSSANCLSPIDLQNPKITTLNFVSYQRLSYSRCLHTTSSSQYYQVKILKRDAAEINSEDIPENNIDDSLAAFFSFDNRLGILTLSPELLSFSPLQFQVTITLIDSNYLGGCFKYSFVSQILIENPMQLQTDMNVININAQLGSLFFLNFQDFQEAFVPETFRDPFDLYYIEKVSGPASWFEISLSRENDSKFSQRNLTELIYDYQSNPSTFSDQKRVKQKLTIWGVPQQTLSYNLNTTVGIVYRIYDYYLRNAQTITINVKVQDTTIQNQEKIQVKEGFLSKERKILEFIVTENTEFELIIPIELITYSSQGQLIRLVEMPNVEDNLVASVKFLTNENVTWVYLNTSFLSLQGVSPYLNSLKQSNFDFTIFTYSQKYNSTYFSLDGNLQVIPLELPRINYFTDGGGNQQSYYQFYLNVYSDFTINLTSLFNISKPRSYMQTQNLLIFEQQPSQSQFKWPQWGSIVNSQESLEGYPTEGGIWHLTISCRINRKVVNVEGQVQDTNLLDFGNSEGLLIVHVALIVEDKAQLASTRWTRDSSALIMYSGFVISSVVAILLFSTHISSLPNRLEIKLEKRPLFQSKLPEQRKQLMRDVYLYRLKEKERNDKKEQWKLMIEKRRQQKAKISNQDTKIENTELKYKEQQVESQDSYIPHNLRDIQKQEDENKELEVEDFEEDDEDQDMDEDEDVSVIENVEQDRTQHQAYLEILQNRAREVEFQQESEVNQQSSDHHSISNQDVQSNMRKDSLDDQNVQTRQSFFEADVDEELPYAINAQNNHFRVPSYQLNAQRIKYDLSGF